MDDITQYMQYLWKNTKDAANCIKNISKCDTTIVIMSDSLGVGEGCPKVIIEWDRGWGGER